MSLRGFAHCQCSGYLGRGRIKGLGALYTMPTQQEAIAQGLPGANDPANYTSSGLYMGPPGYVPPPMPGAGMSAGVTPAPGAIAGAAGGLPGNVIAGPCDALGLAAQQNPTLINQTRYRLCLAQHKAGTYIGDASHWIYQELKNLWGTFLNAVGAIANAAGNLLNTIIQGALNAIKWVWDQAGKLLKMLTDAFEKGLSWLLIAGAIGLGVYLMIESGDGKGSTVIVQQPAAPAKAAA